MSTTPTTTGAPSLPVPHQRKPDSRPAVVQPPQKFAHLKGEALYRALTTDPEIWDKARLTAESGRTVRAVAKWIGHYNRYAAGLQELNDNTIIAPTYYANSPTWTAGEARAWLMRTGRMDRTGKYIPHKPPGRTKGIVEAGPRARQPSELDRVSPPLLAEYRAMLAGNDDREAPLKPAEIRRALAKKYNLKESAVIRRLQRARHIESGVRKVAVQK